MSDYSSHLRSEFNTTLTRDMLSVVLGQKLGEGIGRECYVCAIDESLVVKIEVGGGSFQNVIEWETWQRVRDVPTIAPFFAPCVNISSCGVVLLQKRTEVPSNYPERMPNFFTDFKRGNYGLYKGHVVCHDYGTNLLFEKGMSKRTRKVNWW